MLILSILYVVPMSTQEAKYCWTNYDGAGLNLTEELSLLLTEEISCY